ncbi:MAG: hypothetical protein HXY30_13835 [Pseudorhodoplanes sp.]|nr:hypothetical protein [Pseudorhodoplanes sp.]
MSNRILVCCVALCVGVWLLAAAVAGTLLTPAGAPHHGDRKGKLKLAIAGLLVVGIAVAGRK